MVPYVDDAVNKAVNDQEKKYSVRYLPHPIKYSEKDLTGNERSTLFQLRSEYCGLQGSYKSRLNKDTSLNVCVDCGKNTHAQFIRRH